MEALASNTAAPQRAESETVLRVNELVVSYRSRRGNVQAVRQINLDLKQGETLALIGESGSGKTTLGLSLVRLLPEAARITHGTIIFYNEHGQAVELTRLNKEELRRFRWTECAMVFQSALNALNPVRRIRDHFEDTYKAHRESCGTLSRQQLTERIIENLRYVQLDPERVMKSFPHELSGGMRQRVLLALGLLLRPRVLILDEPTTALDVLTQRAIIEVIRRLKAELGFSMIFVSHDLALAAELADRVATVYAGQIIELGNVRSIFYQPCHPYTVGLLKAAPTLEGERQELVSIPGSPPDLITMPTGCKFHPRCPLATEKCRVEEPPLVDVGPGQATACWHSDIVLKNRQEGL